MNLTDREKIAFITRYSTYEFKIIPFGLCNIPVTFQCLMNQIYKDIAYKYIVVYLDNTNIFSQYLIIILYIYIKYLLKLEKLN